MTGAPSSSDAQRRALLDATTKAQAVASDPAGSAWVSANAGTGKTHVLTNRVLRLLVAGTKPERILCLTYTKAAAAEMSARVFKRLAAWVTADDATLERELTALKLQKPDPDELARARDLFAVAIETPGGLKVQTIHAFCERLLQRFPLEARIAPQFTVLDEETGRAMLAEAINEVLAEATVHLESPLGRALNQVVTYAADDAFDELLADALRHRDWIEAAVRLPGDEPFDPGEAHPLSGAAAFYRRLLGVGAGATLEQLDRELAGVLGKAQLARCRGVLAGGKKSDIGLAEGLGEALDATDDAGRIIAFAGVFQTSDGGPRASLMTKALAADHPDVAAALAQAQGRFIDLQNQRGSLVVLEATVALLHIADAVMQRYGERKDRRASLDFDDLIRRTRLLLSDGPAAAWVLYKLDGGLDHILVDEAQDTAPSQWAIVEALAREFFSGEGARTELARTVFAVGDEKQSIYGFQGAAPEEFAAMGRRFEDLAGRARQGWSRVPLTLSFRTVEPVLAAVDRVFAAGPGAKGVAGKGQVVQHAASRLGAGGLVEVWKTEKPGDAAPSEVWSPLDDKAVPSAVSGLASRIAETIGGWIETGELLVSENRPIKAGDILILLRKRRPFADAMVTALKARGIPVAGADRIRLTEQLAVRDLVVLCDFLLLPEDDLALATVLKSPLIGLDDDHLITLAPDREGSLWTALLAMAKANPQFDAAAQTLKRWRARADLVPPFELLVEILDRDGARGRLLTRLGPEAAEPIDELLALALTYDERAAPSLQGFTDWLRMSEREIKRDMEHGRDEVRVLTVHGAKGLEAPIVFLPDTCSTGSGGRPGGLLRMAPGTWPEGLPPPFIWPVKGSRTVGAVVAARAAQKDKDAEERNRLLYVALTRPRDRLYIAGFEGTRKPDAGSWYNIVREALKDTLVKCTQPDGQTVWRIEAAQQSAPEKRRDPTAGTILPVEPPTWARSPAPREPGLVVPLAPSRLAPLDTDADGEPTEPTPARGREAPVPPSARGSDAHRFLRGTLTHALLEHLPGLDGDGWEVAARRFVDLRGGVLTPRARRSIAAETLAVLRHPEFGAIFGPDSRAEVPIVAEIQPPGGKGQVLRVTGQIDRLVQLADCVLIVDYKTNRPPPTVLEGIAETYLLQLAAYRLAVGEVMKPLPVRAALLWTDGPRLMEVPPEILDAATRRLFSLDVAAG